MKISTYIAWPIPELRRRTATQLIRIWGACSPFSRNTIYLHIVILLACSSLIFNTVMRLSGSFMMDMLGLVVGLLIPPNLYFLTVFKDRRPIIRQFIEQNWDEFRPE